MVKAVPRHGIVNFTHSAREFPFYTADLFPVTVFWVIIFYCVQRDQNLVSWTAKIEKYRLYLVVFKIDRRAPKHAWNYTLDLINQGMNHIIRFSKSLWRLTPLIINLQHVKLKCRIKGMSHTSPENYCRAHADAFSVPSKLKHFLQKRSIKATCNTNGL